jgi:hypothetical protein
MDHWSSFFQDLLALLNVNQDPHTQKSINMAYFFLRVMTAIDQEVVDLTKARTKDEVNLNTNLVNIIMYIAHMGTNLIFI